MSTVKITELPQISVVNANTANTVLVGVDVQTDVTGKITLTTLAAGLYSNNNLRVGNNDIVLANAVGQFTGNANNYLQVTLRNQTSNGSGDFVITADDGSDSDHFINMGINGSTYSDPSFSSTKLHDGYLYLNSSGTNKGNLIIGTTNSGGKVDFIVGGTESANVVGSFTTAGIFSKGIDSVVSANAASANSVINTRISANVATLRGEITANADSANSVINTRISANVATLRGEITANAVSGNAFANLAFTKANNALANISGTIFSGDLTISGNVLIKGLPSSTTDSPITFIDTSNTVSANASAFSYNNANSSIFIKNGVKTGQKVFSGSQTAISINITNDALVRCNIAADMAVTLINFDHGKIVDLWITNTSGSQRTITHGVSALNSTVNSTTFNLPGTSSAHIKYYCFGVDLANTFADIRHP